MKNNKFISKQNTGKLVGAFLALVIPIGYTIYLMFDYEYSFTDARTDSFTSHIEVEADGDARFEESRTRYLNYSVIEQSLYFTADDEDVSNNIHIPEFDTTTFVNRVYDETGDLLIQGDGTQAVYDTSGSDDLYLTYSWLPNAVNELGDRFYPEDDESVNLLHYNSGLWETARFEYDYTIKGAALEYADTAEFYWTVAATDYMLTKDIDVTITLPGTDYEVADVDAYAFGANRVKVASVSKNASDQIEVRLTASRLYPDEYIVTRINFPASALNIPNNTYGNIVDTVTHLSNVKAYQSEYELMPKIYTAVDLVALTVTLILLGYAAFSGYRIYKKYDKERVSSFYGEYYRELPAEYGPAVMGYLYRFKEITKDDVSATLMDLIRRGYLEIDAQGQSLTAKKANYTLRYRRDKDQGELQEHEKQLLKWFFDTVAQGDTLTLDQLENYSKTEARAIAYMNDNKRFNLAAQSAAQAENFFDDVKEAKGKGTTLFYGLTLAGIIFVVARLLFSLGTWTIILGGLLIGVGIIISAYAASIERRSEKGNEDFVRWQAFEKFLKEFSNIKDYPMPGIIVWEHYMVYAVAFGIADLVEKQLRYKYKQLRQEDELQSSSFFRYPGLHYYYWSGINRSFMRAQQTIQVAQQQRNSARGGGGRFGGGGGMHFGGGGSGVRLR
jgi:uncharacterized membrane protein